MEENISLKQNSFVVFMFNYAPIAVIGTVIIMLLNNYIIDWLEYLAVAVIFVVSLVKGIKAVRANNRYLVITDKTITVYKNKRKKPVVIEQFDNDLIEKIEQFPEIGVGIYTIYSKDRTPSVLALGISLKPYRQTELKVNSLFVKIFGERFVQIEDRESKEFIETAVMPDSTVKADKSTRATRLALTILNFILSIFPSLLGSLAVLWVICKLIQLFLEFLLKVIS